MTKSLPYYSPSLSLLTPYLHRSCCFVGVPCTGRGLNSLISISYADFNTEGHRRFRGGFVDLTGSGGGNTDSFSGPKKRSTDLGSDDREEVSKYNGGNFERCHDNDPSSFLNGHDCSLTYGRRNPPSILDRYTLSKSLSTRFNPRNNNRELPSGYDSHPGHACYSKEASTVSPFKNATVSVFWDLDNKPPKSSPYDAALHLRQTASQFGFVMEIVAYANRHAFTHVPEWVRDQRRERKKLDLLEQQGIVQPEQPYVCNVCGRKCKTNILLKKHFVQLHQREQNKRMNRLNSLTGKKRAKFKQSIAPKTIKYKEAARPIIVPKVGYGLESDLRRAGVTVKLVQYKPQAADVALKKQVANSINKGVKCLCLVSDDTDFAEMLTDAKALDLRTVVFGESKSLKRFADLWLPWDDVSRGLQTYNFKETTHLWAQQHNFSKYQGHEFQTGSSAHASGYGIDNEYSVGPEVLHMTFLGSSPGSAAPFSTSVERASAVDLYGFSADDDDADVDNEFSLEDVEDLEDADWKNDDDEEDMAWN